MVAQWLARLRSDQEDVGSNPIYVVKFIFAAIYAALYLVVHFS